MTDQTPAPRELPIEPVLGRYRELLAQATDRAIAAEVGLEVAEAECSALRLRVAELEDTAAAR